MVFPKNIKATEECEVSANVETNYLSCYDTSRLNALEHRLTAKLDEVSLLQWSGIKLDGPRTELPLLSEPNLAQRFALDLAYVEAHIRRTLTTCDALQGARGPVYGELQNLAYNLNF